MAISIEPESGIQADFQLPRPVGNNEKMSYGSAMMLGLALVGSVVCTSTAQRSDKASPFHDYRHDKPGALHKITLDDLPPPFATESVTNRVGLVPRPEGAMPQAPPGYAVTPLFEPDSEPPAHACVTQRRFVRR